MLDSFKELISEDQILRIVFEGRISQLEETVENVNEAAKRALDTGDCREGHQQEYSGDLQEAMVMPSTIHKQTGEDSRNKRLFSETMSI